MVRLSRNAILLDMGKREWAQTALALLQKGKPAQVRPVGHSMRGIINNGDLVTLAPCEAQTIKAGDVVFARIQGRRYSHLVLHLVLECKDGRFLIGNNFGRIDGWITAQNIFGKVVDICAPETV